MVIENLRIFAAILVSLGMVVWAPRNTFFAYIFAISLGLIGALFVAPNSHRREFVAATLVVWFVFAVWR